MKTNREIDCGTPSLEKLSRSFLIILATYKIQSQNLPTISGFSGAKATSTSKIERELGYSVTDWPADPHHSRLESCNENYR